MVAPILDAGLFPRALRAGRERAGLSQLALGVRLGVSQAAVSQWEDAQKQIQPQTMERVAEALGKTVPQLLADYLNEPEVHDGQRNGAPRPARGKGSAGQRAKKH